MAQFTVYTNHPGLWLVVEYTWGISNVSANTTPLTVKMTLHHQEANVKAGTDDCSFSVGGQTVKWTGPNIVSSGTKDTVLGSKTVTISHGVDGNFTGNLTASYRFIDRYGSHIIANPITGTKSITAPGIARASVPTLSSGNANMGSSIKIFTNRKNSAFTHKIYYSILDDDPVLIASGITESYNWTIPYAIASRIPASVSGQVTIYCETYNGNSRIGETKTVSFTATVPNNETTQPTLNPVLSPSGNIPDVFSGMYVQGKTGVMVNFNAGSVYSTVSKCTMTVESKTYTGNPATSAHISASGEVQVICTVIDARGYKKNVTKKINVHSYIQPRITGDSVYRCDSTGKETSGGTYLRIKFSKEYSSIGGKNTCSASFRVKKGAGNWGTSVSVTEQNYDQILPGYVEDPESTYIIQIVVTDAAGGTNTYQYSLASAFHAMHLAAGGKGIAFGKKSTKNAFECAMDAEFGGTVKDSTGNSLANVAADSLVYRPSFAAGEFVEFSCDWEHYEFLSVVPMHYANHYTGLFIPSRIANSLKNEGARIIFQAPCTIEIYFQPGKCYVRKSNGDNFSFAIYGISKKGGS